MIKLGTSKFLLAPSRTTCAKMFHKSRSMFTTAGGARKISLSLSPSHDQYFPFASFRIRLFATLFEELQSS